MKRCTILFQFLAAAAVLATSTAHAGESSLILRMPPGWDGFTLEATVESGFRPAGSASPEVGSSDTEISIVHPAGAHAPGAVITVPTTRTTTRPTSGDRKDQAKATLDLRYEIGTATDTDKFGFDFTTTTSAMNAMEDFGSGLKPADAFARVIVTVRSTAPLLAADCPGAAFTIPSMPSLTDPASESMVATFQIPHAGRPPETPRLYVAPLNGFLTEGSAGVTFFLDMWKATAAHGDETLDYTFTYEVVTPFGSDPTFSYMLEGEAGITRTVVTNTNDSGPGSLRQAILDVPDTGAITFDPSLAGQSIFLTSGQLEASARDFAINATDLPDKVTIDAQGLSRVLQVTNGSDLRLHNLAVTGGSLRGTGRGGGILLQDSALALTDCCLIDNFAPGNGGGIASDRSTLRLERTLVERNTSRGLGGGVVTNRGALTSAEVILIDSEFASNTALSGGAVTWDGTHISDFQLTRCTFIGNQAEERGGALYRVKDPIDHCTFFSNRAGLRGGAIYLVNDTEIRHCTLTRNFAPPGEGSGVYVGAGTTTVFSTIIAGNDNSDLDELSGAGKFTSAGFNKVGSGNGSNAFTQGGDVRGISDPRLSQIADFGGPTRTILPQFDSPATDAGATDLNSPNIDQRGFPRVADGDGNGSALPDAGAAESDQHFIVVTNGNDSGPGSLRQALLDVPPGGLILFFSPSGIVVRPTSELFIGTKPVTIDGGIYRTLPITITGNNATRLFRIGSNGNVTMRNLYLAAGKATEGGAILCNTLATLHLSDCLLSLNEADRGGAILSEARADLTLDRCTLVDNHATEEGGALHNTGTLHVADSTISGNSSGELGGGLWNTNQFQTSTTLTNCIVSNNYAPFGAGAHLTLGNALARNCSFYGNYARQSGGALRTTGGTARFEHCTFWSNIAGRQAGAIATRGGILDLRHVTIAGNDAPSAGGIQAGFDHSSDPNNQLLAYASLIAGNSGDDIQKRFPSAQITSSGYNVVGHGSGAAFFDQEGDLTGITDPILSPPGNFGGGLLTLLPLPGSPALDNGSNGNDPTLDQRGEPRLVDGDGDGNALLDAGAAEALHPDTTLLVTNDNDNGAGSLRQAIADATIPGTRIAFDGGLNGSVLNLTSGPLVVDGRTPLIDAQNLSSGFTIDRGGAGTVMETSRSSAAALRNLTIRRGGPVQPQSGGGIISNGSLSLDQCRILENENEVRSGAGINASGLVSDFLILVNTDVAENGKAALSGGGGIRAGAVSTILVDSTLRNNLTTSSGGGLKIDSGSALLSRCEISGNEAASGGGLFASGFTVMTRCTVSSNEATLDGGGLYHSQAGLYLFDSTISQNEARDGGGIFNDITNTNLSVNRVEVEQATFFGNNATRHGGAIATNGGDLTLRHSTIAENQATATGSGIAIVDDVPGVTLFATIVADNPGIDVEVSPGGGDHFASEGHNLIGQLVGTSAFTAPGDMTAVLDAHLSAPGSYGGPTETIIPLAGSPARDRFYLITGMPVLDQRGFPRAFAHEPPFFIDIGSYEANGRAGYPVWAQEFIPQGEDMSFIGNADEDRNPNGLEYGLLTNPIRSDPGSQRNFVVSEKEGVMRVVFQPYTPAFDVAWRVVRSTNLQNWTEIYRFDGITETFAPGVDSDLDLPNSRIMVDDTTPPQPEAYYRLEVLYTPSP